MHFSRLFGKTLRQVTADADTVSHQLLLRAGMIQQVAAGVYSYLPLGWRVLRKVEQIIREEMDKAGGQELSLPALQPIELWQASGRLPSFGKTMFTFRDRKEHTLVLGPTHEEVVTNLVSHNVQSYRDLPLLLYQIQTKFRDEPRPRGGLLRVREFPMKDLYSFDIDEAGLDISYDKMVQAYHNLYARCGLPAIMVEADSGAIGGKDSHEFMLIAESGEDEIIHCPTGDYAANVEKAQAVKAPGAQTEPLPVEKVATPGMKSIEEVAGFLKVPPSSTLKAVFYAADNKLVFVLIRGDIEVNETKLKNLLKAVELRLARDDELAPAGIVAGYASPIGISGVKVVADQSITSGANFVAGANEPGYHLKNVNYPRDFKIDIMADIAKAQAGDGCPRCGQPLGTTRGIEVGHVFKLGTFLSEKLGALYLDKDGVQHPIVMGCYGIGVGRLLAAAIEQNHDQQGIIWPLPIAPYQVYLCPLYMDNPQVKAAADRLYAELEAQGLEVLYDDRLESPGVKFADADLLGIPLRLVVSPRSLKQQSVEARLRRSGQVQHLPLEGIASKVKETLAALK